MNQFFKRCLHWAGALVVAAIGLPALAQVTSVTDGITTTTGCTSFVFATNGTLTLSPANCLLVNAPPQLPTYSFTQAASSAIESAGTSTITVQRQGVNLNSPGSVTVTLTGGTAIGGVNFSLNVPPFQVVGGAVVYTINFAASAGTSQSQSFTVNLVNQPQAPGASRTVTFGLGTATDGSIGATGTHTLTINSSQATPPAYNFTAASANVVETTPSATVTVQRTGLDLNAPGSVIVTVSGGTAIGGVNYTLSVPPFAVVGNAVQYLVNFAASAGTSQTQSFTVGVVNSGLPGGTDKSLQFSLGTPAGGALGATTTHTLTIASAFAPPAGDVTTTGAAIGNPLPVGTYSGSGAVCESFGSAGSGPGTPGTGFPGQGGKSPCGSYEIPVTSERNQCNSGMNGQNVIFSPSSGLDSYTNTIANAYMFLGEEVKSGGTYFGGNNMSYPQRQNAAFVMKFKTGGAGDYPPVANLPPGAVGEINFQFGEQTNRGPSAVRYVTISTSPCDFGYAQYDAGDFCRASISGFGGSILAQITTGTPDTNKCALQPNTIYYMNTRWEDVGIRGLGPQNRGVISCRTTTGSQTGRYCGTVFGIS